MRANQQHMVKKTPHPSAAEPVHVVLEHCPRVHPGCLRHLPPSAPEPVHMVLEHPVAEAVQDELAHLTGGEGGGGAGGEGGGLTHLTKECVSGERKGGRGAIIRLAAISIAATKQLRKYACVKVQGVRPFMHTFAKCCIPSLAVVQILSQPELVSSPRAGLC